MNMKRLIKNSVWIAAIAIYTWLLTVLEPWRIGFKDLKTVWGIFTILLVVTISMLILSCIGMIFKKKISEKMFIIFNSIYLSAGIYMVYFSWNFYIFKVPTFAERVAQTQSRIGFGVLMPLLLFYYLEKSKNKTGVL